MLRQTRRIIRNLTYRGITAVLGDKDGLVNLATLRGPAKGLRFKLDLVKAIESHYWFGIYDLEILRYLTRLIKPGWTIWDCGTYVGYYTVIFSKLAGQTGKVVAFEPDPHNLERTKANVALNGLNNVQFVHAAIGAPIGITDFVVSGNTNSHLPGGYTGKDYQQYAPIERHNETIQVRCMSLDEAYASPQIPSPSLVKLDIEGAEKEALNHLQHLAQICRPLIVLELHNPECDAAAWEFAVRENYTLRSLNTGSVIQNRDDVNGTLLCFPSSYPFG